MLKYVHHSYKKLRSFSTETTERKDYDAHKHISFAETGDSIIDVHSNYVLALVSVAAVNLLFLGRRHWGNVRATWHLFASLHRHHHMRIVLPGLPR